MNIDLTAKRTLALPLIHSFTVALILMLDYYPGTVRRWIRSPYGNRLTNGVRDGPDELGLTVSVELDDPSQLARAIENADAIGLHAHQEGGLLVLELIDPPVLRA